ncbi:hypothetical protein JIN85_20720 [Luteolibacter pohnpeiensis]|uniref:Uncharacterized protein n=1 Tax=Luteolibacter pohnpeiensis TaxID=454153 RepID=A0A934S8Q8_9BACT|nr:hypothetical protein [Luteolibacter pohnpeiensis]MBK1884846.1 hypothetical protein [Luteolibacter pohnpeiensis]
MKKSILLLLSVFVAFTMMAGSLYALLRAPIPSESSVVGIYTAVRDGYSDQLEIMPDYKFVQTLKTPSGATIINSGTWTLRNRGLDIGVYSFFIDSITGEVLTEPERFSSFPFSVYPNMLIFDWDSDFYRLNKQ